MVYENENAIDFSLEGSDGSKHTLKEFAGKYVVLYFYPRDNSPGCTIEATEFNKRLDEIRRLGAEIVGISDDDLESHKKFKEEYNLKFLLLSDTDNKVAKAYGAYGYRGRAREGTIRNTYIIDKNGKIAKVFERVRPRFHADEVIDFLKSVTNK